MQNLKVALQLYSIREDMEKDVDVTLKKVKEIGYDYVEFAGYFGHCTEEIRSMLAEHGLECISVHQSPAIFKEQGKTAIDYIKTIGAKYCAIPHCGIEKLKGSDVWDSTVAEFTAVGKALKENGIQLMYHNHDFEFQKYEDKFILDWIYDTIPKDIIEPQVDTCWVRYAGYNPAQYIAKYAGRISVVHLKDFVCQKMPENDVCLPDGKTHEKILIEDRGFEFRPIGYGIQNITEILEASKKAGAECVVVEQDSSPDIAPMEAAKISRRYLKSLGL